MKITTTKTVECFNPKAFKGDTLYYIEFCPASDISAKGIYYCVEVLDDTVYLTLVFDIGAFSQKLIRLDDTNCRLVDVAKEIEFSAIENWRNSTIELKATIERICDG